ncbi:hypothetical protein GCM10011506_23530 [Marivirga lumbricoides]|uniref:O-antigen ligase domain-containing protein n=1 Tax=Marivirga lumbricoides TaxID=1046115 RepID=A0ABQ1ME00_9BACT|nr:hypothetical protein GCM10011506_23530 [Marivirga lumbricoides]
MLRKIIFLVTTFFLIIGLKLKDPISIDLNIAIPFLFTITYGLIYVVNNRFSISKILLILISFSIPIIISFCISLTLNSSDSVDIINFAIKLILFSIFAFFISKLYLKYYSSEILLLHINYSIVLHAIIIIVFFLSPDLRNLFYEFSDVNDLMLTQIGEFRIAGFSGGGGALLSVLQSSGIILSGYLLVKKQISFAYFLISNILLIVSILLTGRTGIYVLVIFFPILYIVLHKFRFKINGAILKRVFAFIIILFFVGILSLFLIPAEYYDFFMETSITRFLNTFQSKRNTFHIIFEMYFLPDLDRIQYLFGTSYFGRHPDHLLESDIGYIRVFYGAGIIGMLSIYLPYIYMLYLGFKYGFSKFNIPSYQLLFIFTSMILILELKESFIFARHLLPLNLLLLFICSHEKKVIN